MQPTIPFYGKTEKERECIERTIRRIRKQVLEEEETRAEKEKCLAVQVRKAA